jgi:hypothetical protein
VVQLGGQDSGELEARVAGLETEVEGLRGQLAACEVRAGEQVAGQAEGLDSVRETCLGLEVRLEELEARPGAGAAEEAVPEALVPVAEVDADEVTALRSRVETGLAEVRCLLAAPLAVAFDAVRCEDFLGQDGWLPFTKLNTNLGEGMVADTGVFTVPTGGLYLFLLNVYGAPRDGVTLSIKYVRLNSSGIYKYLP